jgi:acetylornithine deacetylase/succinyl-diaminopimelate desuccinylase-like protein
MGRENVVARLNGTQPGSEAILLQAHYDSSRGPGAADNGTGVSALLEIMRALASGPQPLHDVIAFFDDGEELPDAFTGTKVFINKHPWMDDVRVAIGMDTAVRGPISPDDTGTNNGWLVDVMARAYTGGAWTSLSGGGGYDSQPFRSAGVRVLELEDNYPFHEMHTKDDVPAIVNPGSVQQLGEQALAVRELANIDLVIPA